jgi:hypothetical protein
MTLYNIKTKSGRRYIYGSKSSDVAVGRIETSREMKCPWSGKILAKIEGESVAKIVSLGVMIP